MRCSAKKPLRTVATVFFDTQASTDIYLSISLFFHLYSTFICTLCILKVVCHLEFPNNSNQFLNVGKVASFQFWQLFPPVHLQVFFSLYIFLTPGLKNKTLKLCISNFAFLHLTSINVIFWTIKASGKTIAHIPF